MALTDRQYKRTFLESAEAAVIKVQLETMVKDPMYNTQSFYTTLQVDDFTFVEKHLAYLSDHPKLKATEYMSNLRLKTKSRK
ncbi:MAG: hypothetical protein JWO41_233 [Candidatus Saccharibacteria bacterium]|nr:hypothetical protein [Candidatus Saccharibacteria bacterium]